MRSVFGAWLFGVICACAVIILAIAGCGGGGGGGSQPDQERKGTGSYKAIVIQYAGRPLHCIQRASSGGLDTTSGQYSGLTCDFVAYHKEGL